MIEQHQISNELMNRFDEIIDNRKSTLPFYFNTTTSDYDDEDKKRWSVKNNYDTPQMTHTLYQQLRPCSDYFDDFIKIFKEIDCIGNDIMSIFRMKINLNFPSNKSNKKLHQNIHNDIERYDVNKYDNLHKSVLLYLNDSDGDTIFFDDNNKEIDRVSPKKGLTLIFDSTLNHTGQNPIKSSHRYVMNAVILPLTLKEEVMNLRMNNK